MTTDNVRCEICGAMYNPNEITDYDDDNYTEFDGLCQDCNDDINYGADVDDVDDVDEL